MNYELELSILPKKSSIYLFNFILRSNIIGSYKLFAWLNLSNDQFSVIDFFLPGALATALTTYTQDIAVEPDSAVG